MGWSKLKTEILKVIPCDLAAGKSRKKTRNINNQSRIISRDGGVQIALNQISFGKRRRYLRNPLTTLLYLKWRWIMIIFALGFVITWLVFAIIYYVIAKLHGDLDPELHDDSNFTPCMSNVHSFVTAFLFSLETQHTIGYGSRNPTSECSEAVFVVYVQFIIGVAVQCVTAGLVVAKLQSGKRTSKAVLFSETACIGKCNDNVCLMVRIGNAGRTELVNAHSFGVIIERQKLDTGDEMLNESYVTFVSENGSKNLNLLWPMVIHCQITENQEEFMKKLMDPNSELVVIVEGILEATGQNAQLRRSYLSHEIEIGRQFVDISPNLSKNKNGNGYQHIVDYDQFDVTEIDEQWDYEFCHLK
ncbi:Inward rectifier potassium channel [Mactra antiquata]